MGQISCCVDDRNQKNQQKTQSKEKDKKNQKNDQPAPQAQESKDSSAQEEHQSKETINLQKELSKNNEGSQSVKQITFQNSNLSQLEFQTSPKGIQIHIQAEPELLNQPDSDEEYRKSVGVNLRSTYGVNLINQFEYEDGERKSLSRAQMRRQQYNYMQTDLNQIFEGNFKQKMEEEQLGEFKRMSPSKGKQQDSQNQKEEESQGQVGINRESLQSIQSQQSNSEQKQSNNSINSYL